MNNNNQTATNGIGFFGVLAIVFIALKLTGNVAWPWLWVLSPIWIPAAIVFLVITVLFLIGLTKR